MAYIIDGKTVDAQTIEIDGVNSRDYPDFVDAYVYEAKFTDGTALNADQLATLTDRYASSGAMFDRIMG